MDMASYRSWAITALLVGIAYLVAGFGFSWVAGMASTEQSRFGSRLAAWVVSAIVFGIHISHEHFRMRNRPVVGALHVALAVAMGAFLLALAAVANSMLNAPVVSRLLFIALIAWPAITAIPAFIVAFATTTALKRIAPRS